MKKITFLTLFLIVLIGAYLRFGGIDFGLPSHFHPDEIRKAQIVAKMVQTGNWNPGYFLHPSMLLYSTVVLTKALMVFSEFSDPYETAFLAGRIVSAFAGCLSIILCFSIVTILISSRSAAPGNPSDTVAPSVSALLMAIAPLSVTCSRYFKEDSLFVFFMLCTLYCIIRFIDASSESRGIWAKLSAISVGFSIGSKYTGMVIIPLYFMIPFFTSCTDRFRYDVSALKKIAAASPLILLAFFLTTPFSFFDYPNFLDGVLYEANHIVKGHTEQISPWSEWWTFHLRRSLMPGLTIIPLAAGLASIGWGILKGNHKVRFVCFMTIIFYLVAEASYSKPPPQAERYVLPCIPLIAIAIGFLFSRIITLHSRIGIALGLMLLLYPPWLRTIELFKSLKPDTRESALEWIEREIPVGSRVVLDFLPYAPQVNPTKYTIINNPLEPVVPFLDSKRLRQNEVDYVILSSLSYQRYFDQPNASVPIRVLYRTFMKRYQTVTFSKPGGIYGFHNPTIKILSIKNSHQNMNRKS